MGLFIFLIFVLICSVGAYAIASTICQNRWKEKIPQSKLIGFTTVFVAVFIALSILLTFASEAVFGR